MRIVRTVRSMAITLAAFAVVAACGPSGPTPPVWTATVESWSAVPSAEAERPLAATTKDWFVAIEQRPGIGPAATSSTLLIYPRTRTDGAPAATPSQSIVLPVAIAGLAMSDHVIAVRERNALANLDITNLFGLDPVTDTWSLSTVVPRGLDNDKIITFKVTDSALAIGSIPTPGGTGDGSVVIVPLTLTGGTISWTFGSVVSLTPAAAWSSADRSGFGRTVSIDGAWLAVSGGNDHVVVYSRTGTSWNPDLTLTNPIAPGTGGRFGRSLSIDAGAAGTTPRLLVGIQGGFSGFGGTPTAGRAEIWARGGAAWSLQSTISPRAGSALGGFALGVEVGLDANRAIVGYFWAQVPGTDGVSLVDDYRLEAWNLNPTTGQPSFESELSVLAAGGGPRPHQSAAAPVGVQLAGSHVAVASWDTFGADPSHFSAVSFDRHPAA